MQDSTLITPYLVQYPLRLREPPSVAGPGSSDVAGVAVKVTTCINKNHGSWLDSLRRLRVVHNGGVGSRSHHRRIGQTLGAAGAAEALYIGMDLHFPCHESVNVSSTKYVII